MNTEKPAHPAFVHFPIAFLTLSWSLDILYALTTRIVKPSFLTSRFGTPSTQLDITRLGHFMLCAGLIMNVPTILSGSTQLFGMIQKNGGPWAKDAAGKPTNTIMPRIKATLTHALLNDLVMLVGVYQWWERRSAEKTGYAPGETGMLASAVLLPMLLFSAAIGGSLTYNHGVGLNLGRKKVE